MRHLHAIHPPCDQPLAWYGRGISCRDSYHNGYDNEREDRVSHAECAMRVFSELGVLPPDYRGTYHCECEECSTLPRGHVFIQRSNDDRYDNTTQRITCLHCQMGAHPTAPEGRT